MSREILKKIPVLGNIIKNNELLKREDEVAEEYYTRWIVNHEVDYSEMMYNLRGQTREEGLDLDRVFEGIARRHNPTGAL